MKKACDSTTESLPGHALPIILHICADSRGEECAYNVPVKVDTKHVSFNQSFCGYLFRKVSFNQPFCGYLFREEGDNNEM